MPRSLPSRAALLAAGALVLLANSALAQDAFPKVTLGGRIQSQAYYFDNGDYADAAGAESNFLLRRVRLQATVAFTDRITGVIQPSFENARGRGDFRLRDAFIDLRLSEAKAPTSFVVRLGQEKRPFSRYELTSSNNLPSIERGAGPGLLPLQANELFGAAGYLSHDIGVSALVSSGPVELHAGIYNGAGESAKDPNNAKSFGARATLQATPKLNIGASVFSHDGILTVGGVPDSSFRNTAFNVDGQWGKVGAPGAYLLADYMQGKAFAGGDRGMRGVSLVGAWHVRRTTPGLLYAIEPSLRWDFTDPDVDADDDAASLVSAVLGFYFSDKTQFRVGFERQGFQASGARAIAGVRTALTVHF